MQTIQLIGLGLRQPHYEVVLSEKPRIGWFEVHSENFLQAGGAPISLLSAIRKNYPISLHGVGLSLGSSDAIDPLHLKRLKALIERIDPFFISEHLSWSRIHNRYLPDLLPIAYTDETLALFTRHIEEAQAYLGRTLLIENPSSYLTYTESTWFEADFLVELCKRTGAHLLLDVNNVYVSCQNHQWNAFHYLKSIPKILVKEIHLAGHSEKTLSNNQIIRIDTHDQPISQAVWELYDIAIQLFGKIPTLIERDGNIPPFAVLLQEAHQALPHLLAETNIHVMA